MNQWKKKFMTSMICLMMVSLSPMQSVYASASSSTKTTATSAEVKISKKKLTLVAGKSATLKVTGTSKVPTWKTSNKNVAKVSSKGKVTAVKEGTATITATIGKKTYKCVVTVQNPYIVNIDYEYETYKYQFQEGEPQYNWNMRVVAPKNWVMYDDERDPKVDSEMLLSCYPGEDMLNLNALIQIDVSYFQDELIDSYETFRDNVSLVEFSKDYIKLLLALIKSESAELTSYTVGDYKAHHHTFNRVEATATYIYEGEEHTIRLVLFDTIYKNHRINIVGVDGGETKSDFDMVILDMVNTVWFTK